VDCKQEKKKATSHSDIKVVETGLVLTSLKKRFAGAC
jgi:hypothetical protein